MNQQKFFICFTPTNTNNGKCTLLINDSIKRLCDYVCGKIALFGQRAQGHRGAYDNDVSVRRCQARAVFRGATT